MAQQSKAVKPQAVRPPAEGGSKVAVDHIPAAFVLGAPGPNPKLSSSSRLVEASVASRENFIQVHASVEMMNSHRELFHLWRLKVTDLSTRTVVSDVPYLNQKFRMNPNGTKNPTFDESLQFPSGKYEVALSLYRIPVDVDVRQMLDDEGISATSTIIRVLRTVDIP